jgi:aspartyl-tRNA(Asn)/glutamyl-tRNA(Gln) amidotransferase subunit C
MALTLEQMRHTAKLARLELSDEHLIELMRPINALMEHFERLQALPLDEVEPTSHSIPVFNAFREDVVGETLQPRRRPCERPRSPRRAVHRPAHRGGIDEGAADPKRR